MLEAIRTHPLIHPARRRLLLRPWLQRLHRPHPADSDPTNFSAPPTEHGDIDTWRAEASSADSASWRIRVGDLWLEVDFIRRKSDALLVVFSGARNPRQRQSLPFFSGRGVGAACDVSTLMIADPVLSLDDRLDLAWYAGSSGCDLAPVLPLLIDRVRDLAGARRVMLMGGSGGGFAALRVAPALADSLSLVWNPQTRIVEYLLPARRDYAYSAWGVRERDADAFLKDERFRTPINLPANPTVYLQNVRDRLHVRRHMPFFFHRQLKGMDLQAPLSGPIGKAGYLHLDDFGEGHHPPNKARLTNLARRLLDPACDWRRDLRPDVIVPAFGASSGPAHRGPPQAVVAAPSSV